LQPSDHHNIHSEEMALSYMLSSIDGLNDGCDMLSFSDFFSIQHRSLFLAMREMYKLNEPVDHKTLSHYLLGKDLLKTVGGVEKIMALKALFSPSYSYDIYFKTVKDLSILRSFKGVLVEKYKAASEKTPIYKFIDETISSFSSLLQGKMAKHSFTAKEIIEGKHNSEATPFLKMVQKTQEEAKKGSHVMRGYPTHLKDLDSLIQGFSKGHMTIIGARPGVGKTSVMLNFVLNCMTKNNMKPLIFSLEMPAEELTHKLICMNANVSLHDVQVGKINPSQYQDLVVSSKNIGDRFLAIEDQPSITLSQFRSRAKRQIDSNCVDIIFVDYIQLMKGESKFDNKTYDLGEISQGMKALSKEFSIPIICLAQLNRMIEARTNKEPMLSDLRESGQLEQDADEVLLLHRPWLYDKNDEEKVIKIKVAKNRFGGTGDVKVFFEPSTGKIDNFFRETDNPNYKNWIPD